MSNEAFRAALDKRDERLATQLDQILERVDKRFDRMEARFDLRQDEADREVQREFGETRRDLGELRDLIGAQSRRVDAIEDLSKAQVSASAEGAARGAGEAAGIVAAATAKVTAAELSKGFFATSLGRIVAICVGFTAVVTGIGAVPKAAHGLSVLWAFLISNNR